MRAVNRWLASVVVGFLAGIFLGGCGSPGYDIASSTVPNALQKRAILEKVDALLTHSDCAGALALILPLYNSASTDNSVRIATALSYGCFAGFSFFRFLGDIIAAGATLGGSGFWEFLVQEFPSSASPIDDRVPLAAELGIDAVMSALNPGVILLPAYTLYSTGFNPASLLVTDRVVDANTFLTFLSMALMGSLLNRYGQPLADYHRSADLPWVIPSAVTADGCAFASGMLNFNDGLNAVLGTFPPAVSSKMGTIQVLLNGVVNAGCTVFCQLAGCAPELCVECPTTLRNRASCTFVDTDANSCSAAGIALAVNASWAGPP